MCAKEPREHSEIKEMVGIAIVNWQSMISSQSSTVG